MIIMNLRKIAITAAGVLTGDRKLYQKARCLLNCIDTKSAWVKNVLSGIDKVGIAWKRYLR